MNKQPDMEKGKAMVRAANYLLDSMHAIEKDDLVAENENDELVKDKILKSLRKFAIINNGELISIVYFKNYTDLFAFLKRIDADVNIWSRAIKMFPVIRALYLKEYAIPWATEKMKDMTEEEGLEFIKGLDKEWNI